MENENNFANLEEIVRQIKNQLVSTAEWRIEKAKEFPRDRNRNLDAAKTLYSLAEAVDADLTYTVIKAIDWSNIDVVAGINAYISDIGFRTFPEGPNALNIFVGALQNIQDEATE